MDIMKMQPAIQNDANEDSSVCCYYDEECYLNQLIIDSIRILLQFRRIIRGL